MSLYTACRLRPRHADGGLQHGPSRIREGWLDALDGRGGDVWRVGGNVRRAGGWQARGVSVASAASFSGREEQPPDHGSASRCAPAQAAAAFLHPGAGLVVG